MLLTKIVEQRPSAAVEERLLVIAEAVQEIEHRILLCRILVRAGVVAGGKIDAVMDWMFQNAAVQRIAVDAALSVN